MASSKKIRFLHASRRSVALRATAAAFVGCGAAFPSAALQVSIDNGGTVKCATEANAVVYRTNPGPTSVGTANGPMAGSGGGPYGWVSGCAAEASGLAYVALGSFASAGVGLTGVTAAGFLARGSANFAAALGTESLASGAASTALGAGSIASGTNAISIGGGGPSVLAVADSTTASGAGSIAIGVNVTRGAQAAATDAIALGGEASVAAGAASGIAIGHAATTLGVAGVAVGNGAVSGATGSNVAIGADGTVANALDASGGAVAIGRRQKATGNGAVAIGDPNVATGTGAVAVGADNTAAGDAAGTTAADGAVAIGNGNSALGTGSIAIGSSSKAAGTGAIALGVDASASADNAMAMGTGARAGEAGAVALGSGSLTAAAVGTPSAVLLGTTRNFAGPAPAGTVSVGAAGAERTLTNVAAGVIGTTSTHAVNGSQLFATNRAIESIRDVSSETPDVWIIGSPTTYAGPTSSGANSTAVGSGANVNADNSVAVGTGASARTNNSVALGNDATTGTAVAATGTTLRGITYSFAGANPAGVVSVGNEAGERQVQNVAAGQLTATSTDAVNGSQLYAINQAVNSVNTVVNAGFNVTTAATGSGAANGTSVANIAPGGTATFTAGNNMVLTQSGADVAFAVSPNPIFTSISIFGGPSITRTGIDAGGKAIKNIQPGTNGTDAVSLNQLNALGTIGAGLRSSIEHMGRNAYRGVASAMALQSPPYTPGKTTMTAGVGYYQEQGGTAVALRRTADNGRWSVVGGVAGSAGGGVGVRVGVTGILQ